VAQALPGASERKPQGISEGKFPVNTVKNRKKTEENAEKNAEENNFQFEKDQP
jgi:pyruvate kinase